MIRLAYLPLLLAVTGAVSAQRPADDPLARLTSAQRAAATQALLADLAATPPDAAMLAAIRRLAAEADAPPAGPARGKVVGNKRAARTVEFAAEPERMPRRVDYRFGLGVIAPCNEPAEAKAPAKPSVKAPAKPANGKAPAPAPAADPIELRQALLGCVPDADKALAALLRRLDADTGGDAFAAFLQGWRNGRESFYEALDRTAGTGDSVFFFDVMLDDFRGQFGKGAGAALAGGLQQAHDALHDAFLGYRQYRGFREAVAWSLVLPPDAPLPARLARYEAKVEGAYSLREQIVMAAEILDHDVDAMVAAALQDAPPLPQPVWATAYDPYRAWNARFAALLPAMIDAAGSTDALLQRAQTRRAALATALAERAEALVAAAAKTPTKPR